MHIEKERNLVFHLTLSGYELATLISSARWVAEGAKGELTAEAISQLKQVISNYDRAANKFAEQGFDHSETFSVPANKNK